MSKNELRSSGERRRRGFANGAVNSNHFLTLPHEPPGTSDIKLDASIHFMFAVPSAYFK